jgi:hypothetical protein
VRAPVGRELALALRLAVEADGAVEVFVAGVVREFGSSLARLGHGAGVELAGAVRGADVGPDDALEVDLHRAVAEPVLEGVGGLDDEPLVQVANAVAVEDGEPEALGDAQRLRRVGAGEANHFECRAAAKRDDACCGARGAGGLGHGVVLSRFHLGCDRAFAVAPSGAVDQNRPQRAASGGDGCQREHGRVADKRAFRPATDAAPHRETAAGDRSATCP